MTPTSFASPQAKQTKDEWTIVVSEKCAEMIYIIYFHRINHQQSLWVDILNWDLVGARLAI